MFPERYILDALYGIVQFPAYVWQALLTPELQRLREVRLCNINSLSLTGGANINRYEHSVGVAHLALECTESWAFGISGDEARAIVLAAVLHDIGTAPFGHSVQYVLDREGFEHESVGDILFADTEATPYRYHQTDVDSHYFGVAKRLHRVFERSELERVVEIVSGAGHFGPMIAGSVDLDNIDNVFRLAFHCGISVNKDVPVLLARGIRSSPAGVIVSDDALGLLEEWYETRSRLYRFLLLNPDEFSAKCMLQDAIEAATEDPALGIRWNDVDFELVAKLSGSKNERARLSADRLMLGDLYGCIGIFGTSDLEPYDTLYDRTKRKQLELRISAQLRSLGVPDLRSADVAFHAIRDVNKTEREVTFLRENGAKSVLGTASRRVLVGVFLRNVSFSMAEMSRHLTDRFNLGGMARSFLESEFGPSSFYQLELFKERHD